MKISVYCLLDLNQTLQTTEKKVFQMYQKDYINKCNLGEKAFVIILP